MSDADALQAAIDTAEVRLNEDKLALADEYERMADDPDGYADAFASYLKIYDGNDALARRRWATDCRSSARQARASVNKAVRPKEEDPWVKALLTRSR